MAALIGLTLDGFTKELASTSPAPGGGSVAAYAGAQGFALVAMVCRLTVGREKFSAVEQKMQALIANAEFKQERLLSLVDEDTEGFKAVMRALALPKSSAEEKLARHQAIEKATLKAAEIPLQTAQLCLEGLREVPKLLQQANPNALSDMGVAALSFKTGLDGAAYNVLINAASLKSEDDKHALLVAVRSLLVEGNQLAGEIQSNVLARLEG